MANKVKQPDELNLGYLKFACFKRNQLIAHGTGREHLPWYQRDWEHMECNFIDTYCFKLRFVSGRYATSSDMMSNERHEDEESAEFNLNYDNIEQAILVYDMLEEKWAEAGIQLPPMEIIVSRSPWTDMIWGRKLILPKAFRPACVTCEEEKPTF